MDVILYSKEKCQECERARMLLNNIGANYLEYTLGKDFTERQFILEFGEDAQFPQLAFGYRHIGGLKEVLQFLNKEQLINV
jgi:glutaredoxin